MLQDHMARRTCFKEQYYTGTRRYIRVRKDCRQYQGETMCIFVMVFHQYLRIGQFVWARVFCGTRYYQSASLDCSGTIQKIHMRKIELHQGRARACKCDGFHVLGTFDEAPGTLQSSGVRADAQCCKITWLEELASESNTIQA